MIVSAWPYNVDCLVKLVSFLESLHWPAEVVDIGSFIELLILFELWAVEKLKLGKAVPMFRKNRRPNFWVGCSSWSRHGN